MEVVLSFLADNFKWFMIGAAVLLFALIGFIVDGRKKKKNEEVVPMGAAVPPVTPETPVQPVQPVVPEEQGLIIEEPTLNPKVEEPVEVVAEPSLELNAVDSQNQPQPESIFSMPEVPEQPVLSPAIGETPSIDAQPATPQLEIPQPVVETAPVMPEAPVAQPQVAAPSEVVETVMPEAPVSPALETPTTPVDNTNQTM
ncbi:MAG: hypothetical protein GX758_01385 [Tenericutes bacterium]|nr:hypothetical protein [Mycoplasmatota bacterium]